MPEITRIYTTKLALSVQDVPQSNEKVSRR
jgi:hypothetical protein